jgi:dipeptidyl aminopeptidase/acylaminoacyl peptidase
VTKIKYDLAYQAGRDIKVLQYKNKKELFFRDGSNPALSPDGNKLAYTKSEDSGKGFIRYIVIVDLYTKSEIKLNVPNSNYYGASWSPDNSYIAFNILVNNIWQIGIINYDNSGFRIINGTTNFGLFSPTWTSDSKRIISHNLSTIYNFDLNGKLIDTIDIHNTLGENYFMSSNTRFIFTSENKLIVFSCDINETMKNVDGPLEAVFSYNTITKKITRLSPIGMDASDLDIEKDSNVMFSGSRESEKYKSIYRVNLASYKMGLVVKNGMSPSPRKK